MELSEEERIAEYQRLISLGYELYTAESWTYQGSGQDVYKRQAVLNQVLSRAGRDEQAMMTTLAGLVVVLMMVVQEIANLFDMVKTLFNL